MEIRGREFDFENETYIMGILNATPDSFSDGGKYFSVESALEHVRDMLEEGAAIIDVGGESTRPGFAPVSAQDEIKRVVPVIKGIREFSDVPISIDTTKGAVAAAAINAGADIINDVSGFMFDKHMASTASHTRAKVILMHDGNYFDPVSRLSTSDYVRKVLSETMFVVKRALEAGVPKENIMIDPGVGFGKSVEENLMIINNLDRFCEMGYPVMLGCSKKSVIGKTLDLPTDQRMEGTLATSVIGAMAGVGILRVHDVRANLRAVKMTRAIRKTGH